MGILPLKSLRCLTWLFINHRFIILRDNFVMNEMLTTSQYLHSEPYDSCRPFTHKPNCGNDEEKEENDAL